MTLEDPKGRFTQVAQGRPPSMLQLPRNGRPSRVRSFLRWWWRALWGVFPARMREWLSRPVLLVTLRLAEDGRMTIGRHTQPLPLPLALAPLRARPRFLRSLAGVEIIIPASGCVVLERELPASAWLRAEDILQMERMRIGLLDDHVAHAAVVVEPLASGRIMARMFLVRKRHLDPLVEELAALRYPLHAVRVEYPDGRRVDVDLLPAGQRRRFPAGLGGWLNRLLLAALAALAAMLLLAGVLHWWHLWQQEQKLDRALQQALRQAHALRRQAKSTEALIDKVAQLNAHRRSQPLLLAVIDELSRILPATVHVEQLSMRNGRMHLQGYASSAAGLIRIITTSPMFRSAVFTSPVTVDATLRKERFALQVELANGKRASTGR